jgi:hypothetical protein
MTQSKRKRVRLESPAGEDDNDMGVIKSVTAPRRFSRAGL